MDLLMKTFQAVRRGRVLEFFVQVIEDSGTTFEQRLFGARSVITIEPRNVEAVLSNNFRGSSLREAQALYSWH